MQQAYKTKIFKLFKKQLPMRHVTFLFVWIINCCIISASHAQNFEAHKEKIEAEKVAFLTKKINLTVEEAQLFWPVYNEMQEQRNEVHKEKHELIHKLKNDFDNLEDDELEEIADRFIEIELLEANLKKKYHEKFKKILPIQKLIKYYHAERQFKKYLMEQIRKDKF